MIIMKSQDETAVTISDTEKHWYPPPPPCSCELTHPRLCMSASAASATSKGPNIRSQLSLAIFVGSLTGIITGIIGIGTLLLLLYTFRTDIPTPHIYIVARAIGNATAMLPVIGKVNLFPDLKIEGDLTLRDLRAT